MLVQKQPLMRALRRTQTSLGSGNSDTPSSSSSHSSSSPSSSSSSSWIHLRSVFLVIASSSSFSSSPGSSDRGSPKSPWSRRRRKHALLAKQWKSLFDVDGRLSDGVKFLKKIRSGGVEPTIRAEVWPFLLGMYDVKSSKKERDAIKVQKEKEYSDLKRQCRQISKRRDQSFKSKEMSESISIEDSIVLDSPGVEEVSSARPSISVEVISLSIETPTPNKDRTSTASHQEPKASVDQVEEEEVAAVLDDAASEVDTESSDSDSSEDSEDTKPLLGLSETDSYTPEAPSEDIKPSYCITEDFITWQRVIRLDAIRASPEWVIYSPSQAEVSGAKALQLAEAVGLKDYEHLEPCRIHHAARLVSILEAYSVYDPETGYCQGMSDLLSPIISVIEDDCVAFWCFVGFMRKARHNFRLDEAGIKRQLSIVSKIIKNKDSHLYRHLEKLQAEDCFFVYRMVVVLFRRELTFEQTLCLWEVMWADQAAIRAGIAKSAWGRLRLRAPPTDDLLLFAIAACVLQKRKLIIERYSSVDEIMKECNSLTGQLDVWKLLDDAHDLVVTLHAKLK